MTHVLADRRFALRWNLKPARRMLSLLAVVIACDTTGIASAATNEILWQEPGVCYYCDNHPSIPLAVHVVRIDREQKDLEFHTTLGGKNQIGAAVLSEQVTFIK